MAYDLAQAARMKARSKSNGFRGGSGRSRAREAKLSGAVHQLCRRNSSLGDCEFERRGKSPAATGTAVAAEGHWAGIEPQTVRQDTRYVFAAISTGGRVPSAEDEPAPQSRRYVRGFANLSQ